MSCYDNDTRVTAGPYGSYRVDREGVDYHVGHSEELLWTFYPSGANEPTLVVGYHTADEAIAFLIGDPE
jgi:hypothetical protein